MPTQRIESLSVREGVGWTDLSSWGKIRFEGADAPKFLNGQLTQEVVSLPVGSGHRLALLDRKGKVQADMLLYRFEDHFLALLQRPLVEKVLDRLEGVHFNEKVTMTDLSEAQALLAIQGRSAPQVLAALALSRGDTAHAACSAPVCGVSVCVLRESLTAGPGFLLLFPAEAKERLLAELLRQGDPFGLMAYDRDTAETLRIEAGLPKYGVDFSEANLLPELGREEEMISYTKGCYLGQEVMARIKTYGHVNRRLAGFILEGPSSPLAEASIWAGEVAVGRVTSATYSPSLERPIALGMIKKEFAEVGTVVEIDTSGSRVGAQVASLPFIHEDDERSD